MRNALKNFYPILALLLLSGPAFLNANAGQDSAVPTVQYEIGTVRGYADITNQSAASGISHRSDLKDAPCAQALAPVIEEAKSRTAGPLLQKFTKDGDFHSSHTLTIVFWFDIFGDLGPSNVNSKRCSLHVQVHEGELSPTDYGGIFTYDGKQNKFLPYSSNPSVTKADYLVQRIMTNAYPSLIQFLKEDTAYQLKRRSSKAYIQAHGQNSGNTGQQLPAVH